MKDYVKKQTKRGLIMNGMIKKYLPYVLIIFAVFLGVPAIFLIGPLKNFSAVAYYFILLLTQVVCCAVYCAKNGLDFLFTLIAPIAFLFTMIIYAGGFTEITNIVLLFVYLVAGIFGLFLGDLAFGDERRKREKREKQAAEEVLLQANRRDEQARREMEAEEKAAPQRSRSGSSGHSRSDDRPRRTARRTRTEQPARYSSTHAPEDDDFDYDKYLADIDRVIDGDKAEDDLDDILNS